MSRVFKWLACTPLLVAPMALPGQSLPLVLQTEMGQKGAPQAFANLNEFAACIVKHGKSDAATFLAADFPPKQLDTGAEFLANNYDFCLRRTALLVLTATYIRGAMIEAEYHSLARGDAPLRLGKVRSADSPWSSALAECLVAAQPKSAEAVLTTAIASPQQARALAAFGDQLTSCAHTARVSQVPAQLLRYEIAEALYRRQADQKSAIPSTVSQ